MQGSIPMMRVVNQPVSMTGEDVAADSADEPRDEAEGGDDASNNWGKRHVKNATRIVHYDRRDGAGGDANGRNNAPDQIKGIPKSRCLRGPLFQLLRLCLQSDFDQAAVLLPGRYADRLA